MRFLLSYSGGKDSILALHELTAQGHVCAGLLVMYNGAENRSWFHGADTPLLTELADALRIPLLLCPAEGEGYHTAMEDILRASAAQGVDACAFGDIDIQQHRAWDEARCASAGLVPILPLWGRPREDCLRSIFLFGYKCLVKCIDNTILPESLLGRTLDFAMLDMLRAQGADLCGENGEYHTLVVDGPVFRRPADYILGGVVRLGRISAADIRAKGAEAP